MRERPILFQSEMVRALVEGQKTQTRRAMRDQIVAPGIVRMAGPGYCEIVNEHGVSIPGFRCPYGAPGDRLWVRETWQHANHPLGPYQPGVPVFYRADYLDDPHGPDGERSPEGKYRTWRPSIHMPRAAARIELEITGVRVERLQEISVEDAMAAGVALVRPDLAGVPPCLDWRYAYEDLWNEINGRGAWDMNPWVWAVDFRVINADGQGEVRP